MVPLDAVKHINVDSAFCMRLARSALASSLLGPLPKLLPVVPPSLFGGLQPVALLPTVAELMGKVGPSLVGKLSRQPPILEPLRFLKRGEPVDKLAMLPGRLRAA